ncbi:chromatin modification protein KNAG_0A03700 [Huiozyma naganishii CBS 8797]|uniref:TFIID subunit TAF5 NTD2 domain-containing protein n=1 Tax=Huiozyma naganishii (strain ATCC MYA-139 / BCRC 22969 / CBS 8797 / KCTC 17520 / NBRC 10181 / NCYC 3082 / Yp74L-3) TaxID=1071383 RepID=J7QZW1_HUIN7|nr:hypothetical protein KNAG_0A03700 [Kazachstania naganishii CBS 8797]CCK68050.1 hypothetical protein KNAG_0A03700 [Kazachstania naganishii CBS 8797]
MSSQNSQQQQQQRGQQRQQQNAGQSQAQAQAQAQAQSRPAGQFSAQDLNRIVLEYLNKKGYHRTEAMLRAESGRTATQPSKDSPGTAKNGKVPELTTEPPMPGKGAKPVSNPAGYSSGSKRDADGGLVSKQLESMNTPENYIRAFTLLKNWVNTSLEIYQSELRYIMYPIFIYLFLDLVKKDVIVARRFFDKFSGEFKVLHGSEINRLFSVNSVDHIRENEIASAFESNRYRITISRTVFGLLLYFLNENESMGGALVISIFNEHIQPNVVTTLESKDKLSDGIEILTDGEKGKNADLELNSAPVKLGPFPQDEDFVKEVETELKIKDDQEAAAQGVSESNDSGETAKPTLVQEFKKMNNQPVDTESNSKDEKSTERSVGPEGGETPKAEKPVTSDTNKFAEDIIIKQEQQKPVQVEGEIKVTELPGSMESPPREILPLPPKTTYDIKLEIQKVKESRDAIKMDNLQLALPTVCMYTFHNTNRDMTSLEFSDDSRLAAAGFQDSYIKLWSLDGSSLISNKIPSYKRKEMETTDPATSTLIGHSGSVYSTSFSPDSRFLLSGSEDKTVRLWSLDTHTALVSYKGHNHPVWDVKFSPLGHYFATASHDQTARLWSCDHIYPLRIFAGHLSDVDTVSFHPNGCYVFTGSSDKTCRMWDISTGDSVRYFWVHTAPILSTVVTPDGRWLCTGSDDGLINLWDIGTGKRIKQMRGHGKNAVHSLTLNKEGNVLLSGGADHSVRVWDLKKATNEPGLEPEQPFIGHIGDVTASINQDVKDFGRRRTIIPTTDLLSSFYTKQTPVFKVKFTRNNLALSGGPFREV